MTLTRARFEQLCQPVLRRLIDLCKQALSAARLVADDIHQVLLVTDSVRIPKLREIATWIFAAEPRDYVAPGEAVALGAAVLGAIYTVEVEAQGTSGEQPDTQTGKAACRLSEEGISPEARALRQRGALLTRSTQEALRGLADELPLPLQNSAQALVNALREALQGDDDELIGRAMSRVQTAIERAASCRRAHPADGTPPMSGTP